MKAIRDFLQKVFRARAAGRRFVYQHQTIVNRRARRTANARLRRPLPADLAKPLHDILNAPKNRPAVAVLDSNQKITYIPQPRTRRKAA